MELEVHGLALMAMGLTTLEGTLAKAARDLTMKVLKGTLAMVCYSWNASWLKKNQWGVCAGKKRFLGVNSQRGGKQRGRVLPGHPKHSPKTNLLRVCSAAGTSKRARAV